MKCLCLILTLTVSLLMPALAKEDAARLGIKSLGEANLEIIEVTGGKIINPTEKAFTLEMPTSANQWTTASVTFKSVAPTEIRLRLGASYTKDDSKWVFIDNIKAAGLPIVNTDFEMPKGKAPLGWKFLHGGDGRASLLRSPAEAASGQSFIKVAHACAAIQIVQVPKDKAITVSFAARSAPNN